MHTAVGRLRRELIDHWPSYVVILAGFVFQILLITRSFDFVLTNLLPDDAFYYFQIARHIVLGDGSTFDGGNPTNGYHPLWMVILLPIYALFSVGGTFDIAPIYVSLALLSVFNVITAVILFRLVARITSDIYIQAAALLVWVANPFVFTESLNGLETSISLLFLVSFFTMTLTALQRNETKYFVWAGVLAGLMMLSRLDLVMYLVAVLLYCVFVYGIRASVRPVLSMGLAATVVVAPWFIWNLTHFHMLMTAASNASAYINHLLIVQDNGASAAQAIKAVFYSLVVYGIDLFNRTGAAWLLFVGTGAGLVLLLRREPVEKSVRDVLVLGTVFLLGFALLFCANAGVRFTVRSWYFVSFNLFFSLQMAWVLDRLFGVSALKKKALTLFVLLLLGSYFISWYSTLRNQFSNERAMFAMATWMNETLPANTPVGVFNAGVEGYFSHVRVINLDGLVNNSAYEAMKDRKLWSYILDQKIQYIADFELYLTYRYKSVLDTPDFVHELTPVHAVSVRDFKRNMSSLTIYSVPKTHE